MQLNGVEPFARMLLFSKVHFTRGVQSFLQKGFDSVGALTAALGTVFSLSLSLGRALQPGLCTLGAPAFITDLMGAGGTGC